MTRRAMVERTAPRNTANACRRCRKSRYQVPEYRRMKAAAARNRTPPATPRYHLQLNDVMRAIRLPPLTLGCRDKICQFLAIVR